MRRIEIDQDVYAKLESHVRGFEQPNDVLRRLLLNEQSTPAKIGTVAHRRGKLHPLIGAGLIKPGDSLRHEQRRKGNVFEAEVTDEGGVRTPKGTYQAPSPALGALVGGQIDGWADWRHVPSGSSLRQLRFQLPPG